MPRKPNKRKYFNAKPDQQRKRLRREELSEGMTGFLISTSKGNEQRSVVEAYDLLNEYMDVEMAKLYPDVASAPSTAADATEAKHEDDSEEGQLSAYRTSAGMEERKARFKAVESGCNNLVFISSAVTDPTQFAHKILCDLHEQKKARARYMQRLLPVVATCRADIDTVRSTGEKALTRYFTGNGNPSFLILFKTRNTSLTLTRDMIIATFGEIVRKINSECRANLNDPDYAISVDVIKSICCISVIKDYAKLKKYNVHVEEEDQEDRVKVGQNYEDEASGFKRHAPVAKSETQPAVTNGDAQGAEAEHTADKDASVVGV
ncbi:THUMP domain-containing protein 1-like [Paramacrobiotus metropolitanus]|uniref:THUMP domain-containing protein 1-like n=1 Tax=Paramacrobiotus metropolitanus TaxID=2943436 RepID=UPI002445F86C|nr:THUMP domain-containing protein 1-like [Paramacrobiotus metropolitanus]